MTNAKPSARQHGGRLAAAIRRYGGRAEDWIDLSTGINPHAYPMTPPPAEAWSRLPDEAEEAALLDAARRAYAVPDAAAIVAAPGAQALIQLVPRLRPPGRVAVLSPTYNEHEAAFRAAGWEVLAVAEPVPAEALVVVRPNNPDGRVLPWAEIEAARVTEALVVVDESFADVMAANASRCEHFDPNAGDQRPPVRQLRIAPDPLGSARSPLKRPTGAFAGRSSPPRAGAMRPPSGRARSSTLGASTSTQDDSGLTPQTGQPGLIILRSFGKFFGLAGVRLGFAIGAPAEIERLAEMLGPWAVSGPALAVGREALSDLDWQSKMRARLAEEAARLTHLLTAAGCEDIGGTDLFRLVRHPDAGDLVERLAEARILVRTFDYAPDWLRFGLPGVEAEWRQLETALGLEPSDL
ncbi:MAG: threonine-phosphate decarboxylase [Pseudomonadota bacterium]